MTFFQKILHTLTSVTQATILTALMALLLWPLLWVAKGLNSLFPGMYDTAFSVYVVALVIMGVVFLTTRLLQPYGSDWFYSLFSGFSADGDDSANGLNDEFRRNDAFDRLSDYNNGQYIPGGGSVDINGSPVGFYKSND